MIAAVKSSKSIGIEVDDEYWGKAANRLQDENQNLFSSAKLELPDFTATREKALVLREGTIHFSPVRKKTKKTREQGAPFTLSSI